MLINIVVDVSHCVFKRMDLIQEALLIIQLENVCKDAHKVLIIFQTIRQEDVYSTVLSNLKLSLIIQQEDVFRSALLLQIYMEIIKL